MCSLENIPSKKQLRLVYGWVKNTDAGDVEIFVQGDINAVVALIEWCHQGSPKSNVEKVESRETETDTKLTSFSIRH